ncbi:ATP-dependent DNA ligase [Streptomyces sp. NBC_00354]|uniref:ATP-dependent DNA ligase n=1 Tax=Streptomyces sp. NBC_00354 TaxID=2975723 RepID=UPI002E2666C9
MNGQPKSCRWRSGRVLLQTRRGSLVQDRFRDVVAAAEQLPDGLVLDGELVVWDTAGRLSLEALQRRAAARGRTAAALAAKTPAFFIAFDVLQHDGTELLTRPRHERRRILQHLFDTHELSAPWTLCPTTTDLAMARERLETWTHVSGAWFKIRRRDTTEANIGAITGTLARPQLLVLGRHDHHGSLRAIGRTGGVAAQPAAASPSPPYPPRPCDCCPSPVQALFSPSTPALPRPWPITPPTVNPPLDDAARTADP